MSFEGAGARIPHPLRIADVTAQLQEWVDAPDYAAGDVVAIQLFTAASTPPGAVRRGKDFRLQVSWRQPAMRRR